jgi:predicted kinase
VDATFLKRVQRAPFLELARERGIPVVLLDLTAPVEVLRERVERRRVERRDPSEATVEVLEHQLQAVEPFDAGEEAMRIPIDSSVAIEVRDVIADITALVARQRGELRPA